MEATTIIDDWPKLLAMLPGERDALAKQSGALLRKREIKDADNLLRIAFAYSWLGLSLRNTATWALQQGIADLSDVAVLKQLRHAADFLQNLVSAILRQRTNLRQLQSCPLSVQIVDASAVSEPGSVGTDWRVHLGIDLAALSVTCVEVTDASGGESFTRFSCAPKQLTMGDRGYSHRRGIAQLHQSGGDVLVRLNWNNVPLLHPHGAPFDILEALCSLKEAEIGDWAVRIAPDAANDTPSIAGRLIAIAKTEAAAEKARRQVREQAKKKGRTPDARTLKAAEYIFVFTTASAEVLSAWMALQLYRFRWQIELMFKRFKSLLGLGQLRAHDPRLCRTYLYSKLIAALLIEDLGVLSDFSPWDLGNEASSLLMALDPDALVDDVPGDCELEFSRLPMSVGANPAPLLRHATKTCETDRTGGKANLVAQTATTLS